MFQHSHSHNMISPSELALFLDDIHKNINNDDNTDFRKLILFLFNFTNEKLEQISDNHSLEHIDQDLLIKLITTIELVLTSRLHLLNVELLPSDIKSIYQPPNAPTAPILLYHWSILFTLHHIPNNHHEVTILNQLKSFIINIVNLVTTKLHNFKYIKNLRLEMIEMVESRLNYLLSTDSLVGDGTFKNPNFYEMVPLNSTPSSNSPLTDGSSFLLQLVTAVHLFSILNDFDLSNKLLMNQVNYQLKLESYTRKIWWLLEEVNVKLRVKDFSLIDLLKSVMITNLTNNLILNDSITWNQISLVLLMILEYLNGNTSEELRFLNKSISYSLLKIYKLCVDKGVNHNFTQLINAENVIIKTSLPTIILKSLHIINYYHNLQLDNKSVITYYQTSTNNQYLILSFNDFELDNLRLQLVDLNLDHVKAARKLLTFAIRKELQFSWPSGSINYIDWINYAITIFKTKTLDNSTLYSLITSLGHFPCLVNNDFDFSVEECRTCSSNKVDPERKSVLDSPEISLFYKEIICNYLLKEVSSRLSGENGAGVVSRNQVNPLLCCNLLLTIFKTFSSYSPPRGNISSDPLFEFLVHLLSTHNNRDVRLLVGRILPLYLTQPQNNIVDVNFKTIYNRIIFINFSLANQRHLAESTIKALVELAIISSGDWLCKLSLSLLDLLEQANDQHVNYVYSGFINISAAKCLAPYKLLSPYLPTIAEVIIKKPRMLSRVTELLGVTKKFFLSRTKEYTTPKLLEYYKVDFINEIALASSLTKFDLVAKNLSRILGVYLTKDEVIDEKYIMNVLCNINPKYKLVKLNDLISRVGEIVWYILLQIKIDEETEKFLNEDRINNALEYVAKVSLKKGEGNIVNSNVRNNGSKNSSVHSIETFTSDNNVSSTIQHVLSENVLELVQKFSENVHHIKGTKPFLEKVSSLRAIEFLISKNIDSITAALGQISTCLQASLENPDFQYLSLKCWYKLVENLPPNHLISLIDIVISLIFQKFQTFHEKSKEISIQILKKIYEEIKIKYTRYTLYYLSLPFLDYIQEFKPILVFKNIKHISRYQIFQEFTRRLETSNEYVVQQALQDLLNYCQKYQTNCQLEYFKDPQLVPYVSEMVRCLLDTSSKFRNKNDNISSTCARVLSVIGSLDSNTFSFKSVKEQVVILHDFQDYDENCEFLVNFIETVVLKIFWSSNDPVKQLFSAYAMQNFLRVLKLDQRVLSGSKEENTIEVWNKFSDVGKSTLTPLLTSKYVAPVSRHEPIQYPYFKMRMKFESWLVDFTCNLLKRPSGNVTPSASKDSIFQTCAKLIRDQDISLCNYLLKYICLSHIINGNDLIMQDIKTEFLNILNTPLDSSSSPDRIELLKNCFQSIFEVLDYFNAWVSGAKHYLNQIKSQKETDQVRKNKQDVASTTTNIQHVTSFVECIPMDLIAIKSAECDSYERTILYLEKCFRDGKVDDTFKLDDVNILTTLQSMYSNINDYDALNGFLKKFSTNNLKEKLSTFEYNESWTLAQESFKVMGGEKPGSNMYPSQIPTSLPPVFQFDTKLLKSLSEHGLFDEVLSTLDSKSDYASITSIPLDWAMVGLQASIYSGDLQHINRWLFITDSIGKPQDVESLINYEFAKGVKFLFEKNKGDFIKAVESIYSIVGTSLVPSGSSSFSRNVNLMNQLHVIYDISMIVSGEDVNTVDSDLILKARLANMDQEFDTQWKTLLLHSVANKTMKYEDKISKILLYCSSLARKSNRLDISSRSILKSMVLNDQEANIEYAKLLWARDKQTEAIKSLGDIIKEDKFVDSLTKSKVQLQYAKWLDESNHLSSLEIIKEYNKTITLHPGWEKPYYDLGVYYNKIMESTNDQTGYYERQIVRHFLKALAVGTLYIFEALPKSITIWLDFAQRKNKSKEAERNLNQIVEDIDTCLKNIPTHVWYTALTQILSRIVHEHKSSYEKLSMIIINILKVYPRHSLWYILSHSSSNDTIRRERVNLILRQAKNENSSYGSIIDNAKELFDSLIRIASFKIPKSPRAKRLSLHKDFKVNLTGAYDSLVIPVRSNLEIRLPSTQTSKFNAFPKSSSITFDGFDDNVNIFFSLQMPRQVTIRGSDSKPYRLMVKRDDTRKDAKVVEFTTMINRLLLASTGARKRSLHISNYSVVPLTENMGVIEFVTDVQTMKGITSEQRRRMGKSLNERRVFMKLDEAQKVVKGRKDKELSKLVELFKEICKENPPVLHDWFIDQFSDPTAWYLARGCFIRSSAVMSMVGYIIGLGDRHCENILFFKKNGTILHIDFDCLFDKGATLPTPEIVPFRLTPNMVDAMGICGIEGSFRITCEVTGSLLRENEAPLMNILETLLYDPLLDWKSIQKPEVHLSKVRRKIRGLVNEKEGLPMNIHGQVDVLIQEATSVERLAQMYGGWSAYI